MAYSKNGDLVPRLSTEDWEEAVKRYSVDPSTDRIGAQFGVSGSAVWKRVKAAGVKVVGHDAIKGRSRYNGRKRPSVIQPG
jgi:hypothetical protein